VLVVSVWLHGESGFLGRLTSTGLHGDSVTAVSSPDDLLESVRSWLESLKN
jgi:hypothetical protein